MQLQRFIVFTTVALVTATVLRRFRWLDSYIGVIAIVIAIVIVAFAAWYLVSGRVVNRVRAQYPDARFALSLATGMTVSVCGGVIYLAIPDVASVPFNVLWLSTSFLCILFFLVVNRKDGRMLK